MTTFSQLALTVFTSGGGPTPPGNPMIFTLTGAYTPPAGDSLEITLSGSYTPPDAG